MTKTLQWLEALHIVGVILWVAGLTSVLALLHVHPHVEEKSRALLVAAERKLAIVMDLGATLAIAFGLWRALDITPNEFKHGAWLHVKLTAVVVGVLTVHGMARVKIKKFRNGDMRPLPPVVWILFVAGAAAAAVLGANQMLLR